MKIYLFLLLSVGVYAWAELPDTVSDKAINTNLENLDMKTAKAQKDINAITASGGFVNVGLEVVAPASCGSNVCVATCTPPKLVISGGCTNSSGAVFLNWSAPTANRLGWDCRYSAGTTTSAIAICGKLQ